MSAALKACGLSTKAKTHIGRGAGARLAEVNGASDGSIRRAGRWNQQAMEGCYLTNISRDVVRSLARLG